MIFKEGIVFIGMRRQPVKLGFDDLNCRMIRVGFLINLRN